MKKIRKHFLNGDKFTLPYYISGHFFFGFFTENITQKILTLCER